MKKLFSRKGPGFAMTCVSFVLLVIALGSFLLLASVSFEGSENVPLVAGLIGAALLLHVLTGIKDMLHLPSLAAFVATASAMSAFVAGRVSYLAFYFSGDIMNTGLSIYFVLTACCLVLALVFSILGMCLRQEK